MSTRFPEKGTTERVECPLCGETGILNTKLPGHLNSEECEANQSDQTAVSDYTGNSEKHQ